MQLEDFVTETLRQIVAGTKKAQAAVKAHGGTVNKDYGGYGGDPTCKIEFDVCVSVSEAAAAKAGTGIFVGAFAIGGQGSRDSSNSSETRIKFTIPLELPMDKEHEPAGV